jgi:hypothetical protein
MMSEVKHLHGICRYYLIISPGDRLPLGALFDGGQMDEKCSVIKKVPYFYRGVSLHLFYSLVS